MERYKINATYFRNIGEGDYAGKIIRAKRILMEHSNQVTLSIGETGNDGVRSFTVSADIPSSRAIQVNDALHREYPQGAQADQIV